MSLLSKHNLFFQNETMKGGVQHYKSLFILTTLFILKKQPQIRIRYIARTIAI